MKTAHKTPDQLMQESQGLVVSIAGAIARKLPSRVDRDDLIAYGQVGLAEAARNFDPSLGHQFSTFAYYRIRGAIYDGVSKMAWPSRAQREKSTYQRLAGDVLADQADAATGTPKSLAEDARWMEGVTRKLAVSYLAAHGSECTDSTVMDPDTPPPSVELAQRELQEKIRELVEKLPSQSAALIRAAYFEGKTLKQAADELGISKSWASRQHAKALEDLARMLRRMDAD